MAMSREDIKALMQTAVADYVESLNPMSADSSMEADMVYDQLTETDKLIDRVFPE